MQLGQNTFTRMADRAVRMQGPVTPDFVDPQSLQLPAKTDDGMSRISSAGTPEHPVLRFEQIVPYDQAFILPALTDFIDLSLRADSVSTVDATLGRLQLAEENPVVQRMQYTGDGKVSLGAVTMGVEEFLPGGFVIGRQLLTDSPQLLSSYLRGLAEHIDQSTMLSTTSEALALDSLMAEVLSADRAMREAQDPMRVIRELAKTFLYQQADINTTFAQLKKRPFESDRHSIVLQYTYDDFERLMMVYKTRIDEPDKQIINDQLSVDTINYGASYTMRLNEMRKRMGEMIKRYPEVFAIANMKFEHQVRGAFPTRMEGVVKTTSYVSDFDGPADFVRMLDYHNRNWVQNNLGIGMNRARPDQNWIRPAFQIEIRSPFREQISFYGLVRKGIPFVGIRAAIGDGSTRNTIDDPLKVRQITDEQPLL